MRKQTKIAALVSAAALLAIGASMTSFAAWDHDAETGEFIYLNSDGERAYDEWKKDADKWYHLNEDTGLMDRNRLVPYGDYYYYVDADGARVLGDWRYVDNVDDEDVNGITPNGFWYYFDATTGRAKTGVQTIGDYKFRFEADTCRMIPGWYEGDDGWYYYNDTVVESDHTYGAGFTAWMQIPARDGEAPDDQDADLVYYYFDGGKMVTGSKYIDKVWYYFDGDGILRESGWNQITGDKATNSVGASGNIAYVDSNGAKLYGWQYLSDKNLAGDGADETGSYWFYLDKKGLATVPEAGKTGTVNGNYPVTGKEQDIVGAGMRKINGKFYLFDAAGRMLSGLYTVEDDVECTGSSTVLEAGYKYYFDDTDHTEHGKNGWMITKSAVHVPGEFDDEGEYYCFGSDGAAFANALVSGSYYDEDGLLVAPEDGYEAKTLTADTYIFKSKNVSAVIAPADKATAAKVADGQTILINSRGVAQKNRPVSNVDGYKKYYVGRVPSASDMKDATVVWVLPAATGADDTAKAAAAKAWLDNKDNKATGYEVVAYIY